LSAFSSHPLTKERIEFIRNYAEKLSGDQPLGMDWTEFQEQMLLLSGHRNQ
jgi:predicted Zn-dependent protease